MHCPVKCQSYFLLPILYKRKKLPRSTVQNQQQSEQYTFKDLLNMELRWNSDVENVATAHSSEFFCESRSAGDFKTTLFPFDILASLNSREPSPCTMSSSRKNNIQRWKLDWEIHSSKHFSKTLQAAIPTDFTQGRIINFKSDQFKISIIIWV